MFSPQYDSQINNPVLRVSVDVGARSAEEGGRKEGRESLYRFCTLYITRYTFFTSSTKIPSSLLLSLCSFARAEKMDKSRWILASALSYHIAPIAVR